MNEMAPGQPGGGGVGLSLQLYTQAVVRVLPEGATEDDITSDRPLVIIHHLAGLRQLLRLAPEDVRFEVHTYPGFASHSGLGSTSSAVMGVLAAANECLGRPLELDTLRLLLGHNYVEEQKQEPGAIRRECCAFGLLN